MKHRDAFVFALYVFACGLFFTAALAAVCIWLGGCALEPQGSFGHFGQHDDPSGIAWCGPQNLHHCGAIGQDDPDVSDGGVWQ